MRNRNMIKEIRKKKGLSQDQLASAAGITRPYLSEIERGLREPGAGVAQRLCRELGEPFEVVFLDFGVNHGGHNTAADEQAAAAEFSAELAG